MNTEDTALFRQTIGEVTPLPEYTHFCPPKPSIQVRVRTLKTPTPLIDTLADYTFNQAPEDYLGNGLPQLTLRKLRKATIQGSLDLHGYSIDAARLHLQQFIHEAMQSQLRYILVIHGKGMNSPNGDAILRTLTRNWLIQHPLVLAFCTAPINRGGNGAVIILLKSA
jgi:DNA-nicking Smr family endonuclease